MLTLFDMTAPVSRPVVWLVLEKVRGQLICLVQPATSESSSLPTALALWC